jgi:TRAP-type uncharacterized transport system substrate-binding protein
MQRWNMTHLMTLIAALLVLKFTAPGKASDSNLVRWATATKGGGFQLFGRQIAEVAERQYKPPFRWLAAGSLA